MEPIFYTVTRKVLMPGDHEKEIEPYYKDVYIEKKKYTVTRMLPPGKIKYIFSNPKKLR